MATRKPMCIPRRRPRRLDRCRSPDRTTPHPYNSTAAIRIPKKQAQGHPSSRTVAIHATAIPTVMKPVLRWEGSRTVVRSFSMVSLCLLLTMPAMELSHARTKDTRTQIAESAVPLSRETDCVGLRGCYNRPIEVNADEDMVSMHAFLKGGPQNVANSYARRIPR